jgi:predicted transcriptional regulator
MTELSDLLSSIASTIADYREGEWARPDANHVKRWVMQLDTPNN